MPLVNPACLETLIGVQLTATVRISRRRTEGSELRFSHEKKGLTPADRFHSVAEALVAGENEGVTPRSLTPRSRGEAERWRPRRLAWRRPAPPLSCCRQ